MYAISDEAKAQLANSPTVTTKVEVWNGSTRLVVDPSQTGEAAYRLPVVGGGSVTEDEAAKARRTLRLSVRSDPARLNLVPAKAGDLLHPASVNDLRAFRGVQLSDGSIEWIPMGVFRISKPKATDSSTGGQAVDLNGSDWSAEISRRKWTGPYTAAQNTTVGVAIQGILSNRWGSSQPALVFNLAPTSVVVPYGTVLGVHYMQNGATAFPGAPNTTNDPWADCVDLARSAGCELFFDRQGVVVMRPVPTAGSVPVTHSFVEGESCTLVQTERTADADKMVNSVYYVGLGVTFTTSDGTVAPGDPVVGVAKDTNPNSPTYVGGPMGEVPTFINDEVCSTQAQVDAAAAAMLPIMLAALDETGFEAVDDPSFDAGDAAQLTQSLSKLDAVYIASAVTHPLDDSSTMQVTNRAASVEVLA